MNQGIKDYDFDIEHDRSFMGGDDRHDKWEDIASLMLNCFES